jgi:hypothetical protein
LSALSKFFLYGRSAVSDFGHGYLKLIFRDVQVLDPMPYLEGIVHVDLGAIRTVFFDFHFVSLATGVAHSFGPRVTNIGIHVADRRMFSSRPGSFQYAHNSVDLDCFRNCT